MLGNISLPLYWHWQWLQCIESVVASLLKLVLVSSGVVDMTGPSFLAAAKSRMVLLSGCLHRMSWNMCYLTVFRPSCMSPSKYLAELCRPISDVQGRRHLRCAARGLLLTPRYYLSTYGRRAFSYAGPSAWNSLPEHLRASDLTLNSVRHSLKTFLFTQMTHAAHVRLLVIVGYTSLLFTFTLNGPNACSRWIGQKLLERFLWTVKKVHGPTWYKSSQCKYVLQRGNIATAL